MSGGSWKVAYADFMTAMMAFFLLMWLLNVASPEQKAGIAGYFTLGPEGYQTQSNIIANNAFITRVESLENREFHLSEVEESNYAIAKQLKQYLMKDPKVSQFSGISSDGIGVLLQVGSNVMFAPGSALLTPEGNKALDRIATIMATYQCYLVIRGHTDSQEQNPQYTNKWDLSSARANSAVKALIQKGVNPLFMRSIGYADTRPLVDGNAPDAEIKNSRVEFNFHRPDVMASTVGY